jgi:NADH-quinone oxidoreductase subunit N
MIVAIIVLLTISGVVTFIAAAGKNAEQTSAGQVFGGATLAVFTIMMMLAVLGWNDQSMYYGVLKAGPISSLGTLIMGLIGLLVTGGVMSNPEKYQSGIGEFFGFIIFTILGGVLMVSTNNLIVLYIGIELSSYSTYIMVGYYRDDRFSNEAASKYFLLGAVASAFLLFGMSLVYAAATSSGIVNLNYEEIGRALAGVAGSPVSSFPLVWLGLAMMLVGFGFKLALVPFHSWTPDAYQGAPSMVAGLLSVGPKAGVVIALSSLLTSTFVIQPALLEGWKNAFMWLSILSMTVGNLQALQQTNIKRMLGYSSIAQLGYIVIGVAVGSSAGTAALILYITGYAITNIGAFLLVSSLRDAGVGEEISDYAGLVKRSPTAGILMAGFFMGLAGVPLLAGFLGKFLLFKSAVDASLVPLAIVAVLNTVPAYYYYFRVIINSVLLEPKDTRAIELNPTAVAVLSFALLGVVFLGVYPTPVLDLINSAVKTMPLFTASR